jgi:tight adherence protein C
MMPYLIAGLIALTVGLLVAAVAQLVPARPANIGRRLQELEDVGVGGFGAAHRRRRQSSRERWEAVLQGLGERAARTEPEQQVVRTRLAQAGYLSPHGPAVFWGSRTALPLLLVAVTLALVPFAGSMGLLVAVLAGGFGWLAPSFYLDSRIGRRQRELRRALPDALDLLVTTVEAGLGLNQAMVRVAQEARHISPAMAEELALVNLEIRAGKPREDALRGLGERTGVDDLRSLTAMLIQTDRFGTSIAQALRVHSATMRTKRRQRAEEAAAKTTVKILFPLLLCIFPALFVVILGPAGINIYNVLIKGQ